MKRKLQAMSRISSEDGGNHDDIQTSKRRPPPPPPPTIEQSSSEDEQDMEEQSDSSSSSPPTKPITLHTPRDLAILAKRATTDQQIRDIVPYKNKQRLLILSSRGTTVRFRHLMEDICALLPHHTKEVKHDDKRNLAELNHICEMKNCTGCVFFEVRKKKDLYLWITRSPTGPSLKFLVLNIHTMDEMKLTGNALHGSRPILSFDDNFSVESCKTQPHLNLIREVLAVTFGTPRGHPKSKPFVDRVMHFSFLDGCVWVRNYQIVDETTDHRELRKAASLGKETTTLVEIGPRFALRLIKVLDGGFGGQTLYLNDDYVSPNEQRSREKRKLGGKYAVRKSHEAMSKTRHEAVLDAVPHNPLDDVF